MGLTARMSLIYTFAILSVICAGLTRAAFEFRGARQLHGVEDFAPSPSQRTGTINGRVEIKTVLREVTRQRGRRYRARGKSEWARRVTKADTEPEVSNVVVYLEEIGKKKSYPPPEQAARLIQKNIRFVPHVLPIIAGAEVQIVNTDDFYHNVFSNSRVKRFNIGRQLTNAVVTESFDNAGFIPVFCDIHLEMSAFVVILENPYFTKPDGSGNYLIENVPPGDYVILTWHERIPSQTQEITVRANSSITVDFTL